MKLNETQVRYLLAILRYHMESEIRSVDIAKEMGDVQPTAHKRLESLKALGLITKRRYRDIRLTEDGLALALRLHEQYKTIFLFFHDFLELDSGEAADSALAFMGTLSDQSLVKLERYVHSFLSREKAVYGTTPDSADAALQGA